MDKFNIVWSALWGDYVMAQYQRNMGLTELLVCVDNAADFQFFLSNILKKEVIGRYVNSDRSIIYFSVAGDELEAITDWVDQFNLEYRKPFGLPFPDFYMGKDFINDSTIEIYSQFFLDFLGYMIKNQSMGRVEIGNWAMNNVMSLYMNAQIEAEQAILNS